MPTSPIIRKLLVVSFLPLCFCQAQAQEKLKIEAESIAPVKGTAIVENPHASGGELLQLRDGGVQVIYKLNLAAGGYRARMVGLAESRYSDSVFLVLNDKRRQRVFHRVGAGDTPTAGKPKDMEWATTAKYSFVFSIEKDGEQKLALTAPEASGPGRFKSGRGPGVLIDFFEIERDDKLAKLLLRMKTYNVEKVVARITEPKPLFRETPVLKNGKPLAAIAVNPESQGQAEIAELINKHISALTQKRLPVIEASRDAEALLAKTHLIAPGALMTNAVVGRLYDADFAYSDAEYPGKGGWVVRTVCDPLGKRHNVIVLGGSDQEGIEAATQNFLKLLQKDGNGDLVLPFTREVHVGPRLAAVPAFAKAPRSNADSLQRIRDGIRKSGPKNVEQALDQDAHTYWCFGHDAGAALFRERILAAIQHHPQKTNILFLKSDAFRCLAQAFDLVEEAPVFTDEERLSITHFLLRKTVGHANASIYEEAQAKDEVIGNSHWGWPSAANLVNYSYYFRRYYQLPEIEELWANRLLPFVAKHDTVFKPTEEATGYMEYIGQMKAHMGLALGRWNFFTSGAAAKNADLLGMIITNNGSLPGFGDASGPRAGARHGPRAARCFFDMMARATGDGRYVWLRKKYQANSSYESAKTYYPRRYFTNIAPVEPENLVGLFVQPMDPTHARVAADKLAPGERLYDKLTLRTGWEDGDDYLLLSGVGSGIHRHQHTNAIIRHQAAGKDWLMDDSYDYRRKGVSDHSSIILSRDGEMAVCPNVARLKHAEELGAFAFVRSTLSSYDDVDWDRNVIWHRNRWVTVFDVLKAKAEGVYSFRVLWLVNGDPLLEGRRLKVTQDERSFHLIHASPSSQWLQSETGFDTRWRGLGQLASRRLEAGGEQVFKNAFWAQKTDDPTDYEFLPLAPGAALLVGPDGPTVVGVSDADRPVEVGPLSVQARAFHISAQRLAVWGARRVVCGATLCDPEHPVSFEMDVTNGKVSLSEVGISDAGTIGAPKNPKEWELARAALTKALEELNALAVSMKKESAPSVPEAATPVEWTADGVGKPTVARVTRNGKTAGLAIARGKALTVVDAQGKSVHASDLSSAATAMAAGDLDGDGADEVLLGSADGTLRAIAMEGPLSWEVKLPKGRPPTVTAIAVADLDGDGKSEILASGNHRRLFAFEGASGKQRWACSLSLSSYPADQSVSALGVGDLDQDGALDVAVATRVFEGRLVSGKGSLLSHVKHASFPHTARVTDLEQDGKPEILFDSEHGVVLAYNAKGTPLWRFNAGDEVRTLATADIDGDGKREVIFGGHLGVVHCLASDGTPKWHRPLGHPISSLLALREGNGWSVVVGCRTGALFLVSPKGQIGGRGAVKGEIEEMLALGRDGGPLVAVALSSGTVIAIRMARLLR